MDLILRNENLIKVKPMVDATFKCSYGVSGTPNDFSVELPLKKDADIKTWRYINYGNTEFGGKILESVIDTNKGTVSLYGSTLRGSMQNTIATPFEDLTISGKDTDVLATLFANTTLDYIIDESYNSLIKQVIIPRGSTLLQAAETALREFGEKFSLYISGDKIHLKIDPCVTLDSRVDASRTDLTLDDNRTLPNALYGIGMVNNVAISGAVFVDENGLITLTRHFLGDTAVEVWKEYTSNFKNNDEFVANLINDLYSMRNKGSKTDISIDLMNGDVGDKVKVSVLELGVSAIQSITERHLDYSKDYANFTYSTGG